MTEESANAVSQIVDGLDNLAAVVTMDRNRMADLVQANKTLVDQVAKLTHQNGQLVEVVVAKKGTNPTERKKYVFSRPWDVEGYCWIHGHTVKQGHNSKTCHDRCPGHKEKATKGMKETHWQCQLFGSNVNYGWEAWEKPDG